MHYGELEKKITGILEKSVKSVFTGLGIHTPATHELKVELEIPKDISHGDIAANIAMKAAKFARRPPIDFANLIKAELDQKKASSPLNDMIDRVETKPPGFINFFVTKKYLFKILLEIKRRKDNFGRGSIGRARKIQGNS